MTRAAFSALHQPGNPLVLFNIWDAGSARAVADAGAQAVATGSASVAGAWGYADGEALPLDLLLMVVRHIARTVALPLSVDFEAGFADDPAALAENTARLAEAGAVGLNFEDGIPPENGIRAAADMAARIRAMRGADLFINARTDLFLQNPPEAHPALLPEALTRAAIYADAGADGFFAPGLRDMDLIARLCAGSTLPMNILALPGGPSRTDLAAAGVARISHGPFPWRAAMAGLTGAARDAQG